MNYTYNRFFLFIFLSLFVISIPLYADDSLISWLFSSIAKDGVISIIKPIPTTVDGKETCGFGVDVKGFTTFVVLAFVAVNIGSKVTEKTVEMAMPLLMNYCPVKQWKEDYQRKEEEKNLDKELEKAAFEEKRTKVAQWKSQQEMQKKISG